MSGIVSTRPADDQRSSQELPLNLVISMLDALDEPLIVVRRGGSVLMATERARLYLEQMGFASTGQARLFEELLGVDAQVIFEQIENGEREVNLNIDRGENKARARIRWLPEPDWLLVRFDAHPGVTIAQDGATALTVQDLLQEREVTYRNLLAAYLRLQDVNRQKTVFLGSAAHELKTPLAVIKGYYDLLLTGSLGKLSEKQRNILEESKESCERLVRLVSMFLNYSALESGKLVLQLRENDLKDCLDEVAKRWQEAFQRKGVRLETALLPALPAFKFDYQKVQQAVANLVDNALKHTPEGGSVKISAEPHFWERRVAEMPPLKERRAARMPRPNSVRISVADTGSGIAPEHHQEIFEDFVRVDRNTSGMGLGLAIAKRLVQAHRGKIWVDSELQAGSCFTFLLPTEPAE
ncbi:MAG: HAMP domain-containing histidine kinase [Acidobacteriia bacterium]|nr:HAMP domain-containing histidine kinase [Terriglobia bacterium]